jgi:hypothetical protein
MDIKLRGITLTGGVKIPRDTLHKVTQKNLEILEKKEGYKFQKVAYKFPVFRDSYIPYELIKIATAHTFVIKGVTQDNTPTLYVRRETIGIGAGQTKLYTKGKKVIRTCFIPSIKRYQVYLRQQREKNYRRRWIRDCYLKGANVDGSGKEVTNTYYKSEINTWYFAYMDTSEVKKIVEEIMNEKCKHRTTRKNCVKCMFVPC